MINLDFAENNESCNIFLVINYNKYFIIYRICTYQLKKGFCRKESVKIGLNIYAIFYKPVLISSSPYESDSSWTRSFFLLLFTFVNPVFTGNIVF